ncbi:MAG: hypothetical protein ABI779_00430 [Acidobacteriota bacterium]
MLVSRDVAARMQVLTEFGVTGIFSARSIRIKSEYDRRLKAVSEHIDIMGFGLNALREDYGEQFTHWAQRARVRILILDPEFPDNATSLADQRDAEEKKPRGATRAEILQFVEHVRAMTSGQLEVRMYRCIPSVNVFRMDDELFWGPYLIGEPSRSSPTFIVQRGGLLFDRMLRQFERIWTDYSRPIVE